MSSLGRKSMKKALERLKKDSTADLQYYLNTMQKFLEMYDKMTVTQKNQFSIVFQVSINAIRSYHRYVETLEDCVYELDEGLKESTEKEYQKILELARKSKEEQENKSKPIQKKGKKEEPSYIK